jgi:hypothetical protein
MQELNSKACTVENMLKMDNFALFELCISNLILMLVVHVVFIDCVELICPV